jgi:hypothetical protein
MGWALVSWIYGSYHEKDSYPPCGVSGNSRWIGVFTASLCVLLLTACDLFKYDLDKFLAEQTGTIRVGQAAPEEGQAVIGEDGYICLPAGGGGFSIPVDNPLGYELTVETSFTQTIGSGISGITVTQEGRDSLAVHIPNGNTAGNEGRLHIKVKTAKEGRILYEGDIDLAFINSFDTRLAEIRPSNPNTLNEPFNPDNPNYSVSNASDSVIFMVRAQNPAAQVTIDGVTGIGGLDRIITPGAEGTEVLIRVELAHGADSRNYRIMVYKAGSGSFEIAVASAPAKLVYQVQGAENTGLDTEGLALNIGSGASWSPLDLIQCNVTYDFTSPGTKTVTVQHKNLLGLTTTFEVWVLGLTGLTVTGPGGYAAALGFDSSSPPPALPDTTAYGLGAVSYNVSELYITAESGVADAEGASLTVTRTAPSVEGGDAVSGQPVTIGLVTVPANDTPPPLNTIEIEVSLSKGDFTETRVYTIRITRAGLNSGAAFFVSETGDDDEGNGTEEEPYATVGKVLDLIRGSGLESVPEASITIIISGTVTADTGTANGMVDISGGGYPEIRLKGKGSGADAGILDAAGKNKRVLYIGGGNKVTLGDNLTLRRGDVSSLGYPLNDGGGVFVEASTFTMNGGVIEENSAQTGGGVYVNFGSAFFMNGGTIQENTISVYGAGVYVYGSTFAMSGGTIKNNTTSSLWYSYGGGVYATRSEFTMSGGTIQGNTAVSGGGVYVTALGGDNTFTKIGGIIYGDTDDSHESGALENTAANGDGHAVKIDGGVKRNSTAGETVYLYAKYNGSTWTYIDPAPGGLGDTTGNWPDDVP